MAKGDSLYTHERSAKSSGAGKRVTTETKKVEEHPAKEDKPPMDEDNDKRDPGAKEPKNEKGETQGEERDNVKDKAPNGESKAGDKTGAGDELAEGLKNLLKQHEAERRDHHNNHRDATRQMDGRHTKSIKDLFAQHMEKQGGGEDGGEAEEDAAPAEAGNEAPAAPPAAAAA